MRVLLEIRSEAPAGESLVAMAETTEPPFDLTALANSGMEIDQAFPAVVVPKPQARVRVLGGLGFDHDCGWGALSPATLISALP